MIGIYFLIILMIIIWSLSFIVVDIAVEIIPPLSLALYRFIVASASFIVLDIFNKLRKIRKKEINSEDQVTKESINSKNLWILIIAGSFTGASLFFFAQYTAIKLIGPSLPALFVCLLAPVIISILSLIIFKEKLNSLKIGGFTIASIGSFLLITGGDLTVLSPASPNFFGYILALLTPFLWALFTIIVKKISKSSKKSDIQILKYVSYFGTIELFFFVLINGELMLFVMNFLNLIIFGCALYLGLACYIFGYYIWQNSQKKLKSSKVSSFLYIEPFLTLIFSFLFKRSEQILVWNIVGGIIVLSAVLLINYDRKKA